MSNHRPNLLWKNGANTEQISTHTHTHTYYTYRLKTVHVVQVPRPLNFISSVSIQKIRTLIKFSPALPNQCIHNWNFSPIIFYYNAAHSDTRAILESPPLSYGLASISMVMVPTCSTFVWIRLLSAELNGDICVVCGVKRGSICKHMISRQQHKTCFRKSLI